MARLEPELTTNKDDTNVNKRSEEFKKERLEKAKAIVEEFNQMSSSGSKIIRFFLYIISICILIIATYCLISFKLFPEQDFVVKIGYSLLFSSAIGYFLSAIVISASTFFESRDYSLLALLIPPTILLGCFSRNIRKLVGFQLVFHFIFILIFLCGVFLLCLHLNLTIGQLIVFMKSTFAHSDSLGDGISGGIKKFLDYLFGLHDPKYK